MLFMIPSIVQFELASTWLQNDIVFSSSPSSSSSTYNFPFEQIKGRKGRKDVKEKNETY